MSDPLDLETALARHFGLSEFRPGQEEIVRAVSGGEDVLAIMPTGSGKSLCYQLPAVAAPGTALVISPLIALMNDQVRALRENGIAAAALNSANGPGENAAIEADLVAGRLDLLYMAPERLGMLSTTRLLRKAPLRFIAVDEAHCVSQWGHDFRPDYLEIGRLRAALGLPLAAFTATADPATREEIVARLFGGRTPRLFVHGFDRPNLHLAFAVKDRPRRQVLDFVHRHRGESGIVYCASRARTETLAAALAAEGHPAVAYHAGLETEARREVERRFAGEEALIVVATVAFGMGIDRPDIRWVLHADLPKSVEAWYQEIGRAGRDGLPAETLTLYGPDDIRLRRMQIDESTAPDARKALDHARLNALLAIAEATGCRRVPLLRYFGEESAPCGNCDLCAAPPETFDGTEAAQKALSAAVRSGERFGAGHLIDILTGTATERIRRLGHDRLPTFGVGREFDRARWQGIFRQLMAHDLLRPEPSRHGALVLSGKGRAVLRGERRLRLREDTIRRTERTPRAAALVAEEDAPLFAALRALRRKLAQEAGIPAYMIFNDRTLIAMAETRPADLDALARIPGVGAVKLGKYGPAFLEVITGTPAMRPPARRMKLAGTQAATLHDRLLETARALERGPHGTDRPVFCPPALVARIAARPPASRARLEEMLGPRRAERLADAFWEILRGETGD